MANASGGAAGQRDPNLVGEHKILGLVVHGVGEQTVGSTLRCVVSDFFPLIHNCVDSQSAGLDVAPLDDAGTPQVRLSFRKWLDGQRYERYEVLVREVNWARAFAAPSFGNVAGGLWKLLKAWLPRTKHSPRNRLFGALWLIGRLLLRALSDVVAVAAMIVCSPVAFLVALIALVGARTGWPRRVRWRPFTWFLSRYATFQPSVVELAVIVVSPAILAVFIVLVIIDRLGPLQALVPDKVALVRRQIVSVMTSSVGDVSAYATQPWEASQIRTRFEERFKQLVEQEGKGADSMFVIAHSLGCPVSYEGLSGRRMAEFINRHFDRNTRPLFYFTVGSALPAIWAVVPEEEQSRLYRPLPPPIRWEDFRSAYDPVQSDLICKSVDTPAAVSRPDGEHEVLNQMDLFSEHTAYWNNAEQVLAPILNRLTNGTFAAQLDL